MRLHAVECSCVGHWSMRKGDPGQQKQQLSVCFACCSCHVRAQTFASKGNAGLRNSEEVRLNTGLTPVLSCSTHR